MTRKVRINKTPHKFPELRYLLYIICMQGHVPDAVQLPKLLATLRVEIFGSVIFSVNRERRCSVERNFRYHAHCLFEGVANVR